MFSLKQKCDNAWEYISYLGNQNFLLVTGLSEMDVFLGTRIVSPQMVPFFLKTRKNIPGDNSWGVTHYPILDAIATGHKVVGVTINYVHPSEQKTAEENLTIFMKRIEQTALLTAETTLYAMNLGLISREEAVENVCTRMLAIESKR
jgi:hypothetical protein